MTWSSMLKLSSKDEAMRKAMPNWSNLMQWLYEGFIAIEVLGSGGGIKVGECFFFFLRQFSWPGRKWWGFYQKIDDGNLMPDPGIFARYQ